MEETMKNITKQQEEKRLEDFKKIAENWTACQNERKGKLMV